MSRCYGELAQSGKVYCGIQVLRQARPADAGKGGLHDELASVQLSYGEFHKIVGGHPSLGNWDVDAAPEMSWSDGDTWRMNVQLPANQQIEFKVRCMRTYAKERVRLCASREVSVSLYTLHCRCWTLQNALQTIFFAAR